MRALLWRVVYAAICVVMFLVIIPLFAQVVGFPLAGALWTLIKVCIACIAVLYVLWGPAPPAPF